METQKFGDYLRAKREAAGLNTRQLAEKLGTSNGYVSRLETGIQSNPTAEFLTRLARALDIDDTSELFTFFGIEPARTLPGAPVYFRRKYGLSDDDAQQLARLVDEFRTTHTPVSLKQEEPLHDD